MLFGLPIQELLLLALALLSAGAVTGFLAGIFGVGGGAVIVPVLYSVFGAMGVPEEVRAPLCVGTSLAVIIPTSISSFRKHLSKGAVDMAILRLWAVPVVIGVIVGSLVARVAPAEVFKITFAAVASASAARLLFGRDSWKIADTMPSNLVMRTYGGLIGVLSALMGIGGGQLSSLFMLFYGRPIHQAVATSSGLGVLISIPGTLGFVYAGWPKMDLLPPLSLGYVSVLALVLMIPTSTLVAPMGASIAHKLPKRQLELAFGLFLAVVSARFVWASL